MNTSSTSNKRFAILDKELEAIILEVEKDEKLIRMELHEDEEFQELDVEEDFYDDYDDMDGDHTSALRDAGFGTDEDYGYYGQEEY